MATSTRTSVTFLCRILSSVHVQCGQKNQQSTWCRISRVYSSIKHCSTSAAVKNGSELSDSVNEPSLPSTQDLLRGIGKTKGEQKTRSVLKPDQPSDAKILRVAIIGTPNSGKSTLTNSLMGWKVSAVSQKVHTTRKNTLAVHTEDNTQVVFLDTPGILHPSQRKKHNLEQQLVTDPESSLLHADMVAVMIDISNTWTRHQLDSRILHLLHLNKQLPSILILNKIDLVKHKGVLLGIVRKLTGGYCGGQPLNIGSKKTDEKMNLKNILDRYEHDQVVIKQSYQDEYDGYDDYDDYEGNNETSHKIPERKLNLYLEQSKQKIHEFREKRDEARMKKNNENKTVDEDVRYRILQLSVGLDPDVEAVIQKSMENNQVTPQDIKNEIQDMKGWKEFSEIFMISAYHGDGVQRLKEYFVKTAKPGDWHYHSSLVTDQNPQELAMSCVWEKLLDYLPKEIPYQMYPRIVHWEVDEDDILDVVMTIDANNPRYIKSVLGRKGETIRQISHEAKQEIMNALRCDMKLSVRIKKTK
ncbi:GTPase Era, mitochondrial isoform X1 [Patella vulgata]|uniref:GTPase Era, mitochondrial isoform X1 n=2 Tax=Patella vulgata TaxID=6465 RepID=UPI0021808C44|nr:GTPase Era, mitochondrial isoform X1 [Patella vulgata]